jgi:hypothetical protein
MGYPLEIVFLAWVLGFGALSYFLRGGVVSLFSKSPLPRFVNYCIILLPLVLVEESRTCETPYFSCIQATVPAFLLFFALIYAVQGYARLSWLQAAALAGILGWIVEFIIVNRLPVIAAAGWLVLLFVSVLCFLIYAVLAMLPCYYAERTRK